MWSHLIKLVSLSKGALIVGVAASAAMVSNAEFSTPPSQHELPSTTPSAIVSTAPSTAPVTEPMKPTENPSKPEPKTEPKPQESATPSTTLDGLIKECVTKYAALRAAGDSASQGDRESTTAVCKAAIQRTGLTSAEFAAKYGLLTPTVTEHPTTTPATTNGDLSPEALALVKECVTKYTLHAADATAICVKAIQLTGLTSAAFGARFLSMPTTTPKASPTVKPATAELEGLIYACRLLQGALVSTSPAEQVTAASAACAKAIAASGLSAPAFWAKWAPIKPTAAPSATPAPVSAADLAQLVTKCLDLYKAMATTGDTHSASEACGAAIRASGMTSSDFWAKYHPTTN